MHTIRVMYYFQNIRLHPSIFRNRSQIRRRRTEATIFMSRNSPMNMKFNAFNMRGLIIRFEFNFKRWNLNADWFIVGRRGAPRLVWETLFRLFLYAESRQLLHKMWSTSIFCFRASEKWFASVTFFIIFFLPFLFLRKRSQSAHVTLIFCLFIIASKIEDY